MFGSTVWNVLGIMAIFLLGLGISMRKNAIWKIMILGVIVAIVICLVTIITANQFNWDLLKKVIIVSILTGASLEVLIRITRSKKKRSSA